jgi:hypothetical protein
LGRLQRGMECQFCKANTRALDSNRGLGSERHGEVCQYHLWTIGMGGMKLRPYGLAKEGILGNWKSRGHWFGPIAKWG